MKKVINKLIYSRTVWTLILLVAINVSNAYFEVYPSSNMTIINAALATVAAFFKINPSQKY